MKIKTKLKFYIQLILLLTLFWAPSRLFAADLVAKEEIISLVNQEREKEGLAPLVESQALNEAAALKAQDMIGNNYFAHTSPDGVDPWHWFEQVKYPYKYAGENLAMDFVSASSVMRAWMKSPTHKENIISVKYKEIGVAISSGIVEKEETMVAVQLFGTRLSDEVEVSVISNQAEENKKEENKSSVIIQEASAKPWAEENQDEVLVYAQLVGQVAKVKASIGENSHELLEHEDGLYMGLFSLDGADLGQSPITIKAEDENGQVVSYQIPKGSYSSYLEKKNQISEQKTEPTEIAQNEIQNAYVWKNFMKQNIFLAVALSLFVIMIGNVWILEKEEQQLIENLRAV